MSHRSVVQLLQDVANSLSDNIQFGYGRRSDFNQTEKQKDTFVWLLPLTAAVSFTNNNNTENYQKAWNCFLLFFRNDATDSTEVEFKPILDDVDVLADKFIHRLNDWSLNSQDVVGAITLRSINQQPYIKDDADILTGWFVSFQVTVSDDFDYCTPDNIDLYAGNR